MGAHVAEAGVVTVPKEIAHATLEANPRKNLRRAEKVIHRTQAIIGKHRLPEFIQALAASKPACRNHHRQITRFQLFCLLHEQLVNRCGAGAIATIVQLVRRVANDHVELHVCSKQLGHASLDVVCMNKGVGVCFLRLASV